MWWPSFLSVLHDLWQFVVGGAPVDQVTPPPPSKPQTTPARPRPERLEPGVAYTASHPTTIAIRTYLTNTLELRPRTAELTTYEWLTYYFAMTGRPLPWLALALAPVGRWHQALREVRAATSSIEPKTDALIEWQDPAGGGHLGLVQSVSPDDTISVAELGVEQPGVLSVAEWPLVAWRERRPVFTSIQ